MRNLVLSLSILLFFASCSSDNNKINDWSSNEYVEARQNIAKHTIDNFILPAFSNLTSEVNNLKTATNNFTADQSASNLTALRNGLKSAWLAWQKASLFQYGPSVNQAIHVALNVYPANTMDIDNNIASSNFQLGGLSNNGIQGFPALDYVLNGDDNNFTQEEINFIVAVVDHIQSVVNTTANEWTNSEFTQSFQGAGFSGIDVGSALGLIVNSIDIHFQRKIRDGKVAIPAGVRSSNIPRPHAVEVYYGRYSKEMLMTSINAYEDYFMGNGFNGNNGTGLLSYLELIEQEGLSTKIKTNFTNIKSIANGLDNSLANQIETNNELVLELFMEMQELVTAFKTDMASSMGISITNADTDGD